MPRWQTFLLVEEPPVCIVCGGPSRPLLVREMDDRSHRALMGCNDCGMCFTHPMPSEAKLAAFYGSDKGWVNRGGEGRKHRDSEAVERSLERKRELYRPHYELLRPMLKRGKALDYGCASGFYLDLLKEDGWDTRGIEPSPQREIAALRHTLLEHPAEGGFDFVILNHVVEHLRDPLAVMSELARSMKGGGKVFVSVPHLGRLAEHHSFGYTWNRFHLCSYTFEGMRSLLLAAGFDDAKELDGPEWRAMVRGDKALRVIATRSQTSGVIRDSANLTPAVEALSGYVRWRRESRRKKQKKRLQVVS